MKTWFRKRLNWKVLLMSLLINMVAIGITAFILPGINLTDNRFQMLVLFAVFLGLLNTFVKPLLQLVTIRLLFITYGLVLILTNTIVLLLLSAIFEGGIEVRSFPTAILGGIMIGLISIFLDYAFGVIPPLGYEALQSGIGLQENLK
jgi:putative membrane protein